MAGEAGIGKTELVRAYVQKARGRRCGGCATRQHSASSRSTSRCRRGAGAVVDTGAAGGVSPSTRSSPRSSRQLAAEVGCSSSRICTGPMRRPSTSCGSWPGGSSLPLLMVLTYREAGGRPTRCAGSRGSRRDAQRSAAATHAVSRGAVAQSSANTAWMLTTSTAEPRKSLLRQPDPAQPESALPQSVRDAVVARTAGLAATGTPGLELLSCAPEAVDRRPVRGPGEPAGGGRGTRDDRTGRSSRKRSGVPPRDARLAVQEAVAPGADPPLHDAMIAALEAVGADASVPAHHAMAARTSRDPSVRPGGRAEAARSGRAS